MIKSLQPDVRVKSAYVDTSLPLFTSIRLALNGTVSWGSHPATPLPIEFYLDMADTYLDNDYYHIPGADHLPNLNLTYDDWQRLPITLTGKLAVEPLRIGDILLRHQPVLSVRNHTDVCILWSCLIEYRLAIQVESGQLPWDSLSSSSLN